MQTRSTAGAGSDAAAGDGRDDTGDLRLGLVRAMMWTALLLIMLIRFLAAWQEALPWTSLLVAMAPYPALAGLLTGPHRPRVRSMLLVALVVSYAAPFLLVGIRWDWLPWPLAVVALCSFRGRVGWPLFALILVATDIGGLLVGEGALTAYIRVFKTTNDGLIIFGLYALVAMVTQLHATRGELTRRQLLHERRRLDGELTDVVGTHLRTLREQLARAVGAPPGTVREHLGAAVDTARLALADVRQAASDCRALTPAPAAALTGVGADADGRRTSSQALTDIRRAAGEDSAASPMPVSRPVVTMPMPSAAAAEAPIQSPRVAHLVLAALYTCEAVNQSVSAVASYHRPQLQWLMAPLLVAAGAVLLLMRPTRRQILLAALLLGPTSTPLGDFVWEFALLGNLWPFVLALVLTRMRRPGSWIITGVAVVLYISEFFYPPPVPNLAGMAAYLTSMTILTWSGYSLIRLSGLVTLLRQARRDLARETLTRERTRIAQDLHDVLSFSLSAIALKGELCQRMLASDPERAREQLAALPELADRALAELEAVAYGPVVLRAEEEVASARTVLETAGVRLAVTMGAGPLPDAVDAALAAVLREAVTNIVRHSAARTCTIAITDGDGLVRLLVVNDGALEPALLSGKPSAESGGGGSGGSGLVGMTERTGGRLTARPLPGGRFELLAEFATTSVGAQAQAQAQAQVPAQAP